MNVQPSARLQSRRNRAVGRIEKAILGLIAGGAVVVAAVETVLVIQRIVSLASGPVRLTEVPLATKIAPTFLGGASDAVFDSVSFTIEELSSTGRAALIAATIASALLVLGICAAVIWLCVRVFLGKPFVASATWAIGLVAILVVAAGLAGPALTGVAEAEAATALGATELPSFLVQLDLGPLAWGMGLAVLAGAFELGQRLQRDTEGLV